MNRDFSSELKYQLRMPVNISEQGGTWSMWYFRDVDLVLGLAHCTHL